VDKLLKSVTHGQTYGYLPGGRTSLPGDWYQTILLGDRYTCMWTTCPRSLPDSETAGSWTRDLSSRKTKPQPYGDTATK